MNVLRSILCPFCYQSAQAKMLLNKKQDLFAQHAK